MSLCLRQRITVSSLQRPGVVYCQLTCFLVRVVTGVRGEWLLDIAPNYYDISSFPKGEVKTALMRIEERVRRREKMKGGK